MSTLSVPVTGSVFGFDFNPVADRLRIVSESNQNLQAEVATGAVTVDGDLVYTGADSGTDPKSEAPRTPTTWLAPCPRSCSTSTTP